MCKDCKECYSDEEKKKLKDKGWTEKQIIYTEGSVVEEKIKELIN